MCFIESIERIVDTWLKKRGVTLPSLREKSAVIEAKPPGKLHVAKCCAILNQIVQRLNSRDGRLK
jgi:hypothetical protein